MFPGWVVASSQRGGLIINIVDENTLNQNWNDCVAKLSRVCCSWPSTRRAFKLPVSLPDLRLLLIGLFLWSNVCNHASGTPFECFFCHQRRKAERVGKESRYGTASPEFLRQLQALLKSCLHPMRTPSTSHAGFASTWAATLRLRTRLLGRESRTCTRHFNQTQPCSEMPPRRTQQYRDSRNTPWQNIEEYRIRCDLGHSAESRGRK